MIRKRLLNLWLANTLTTAALLSVNTSAHEHHKTHDIKPGKMVAGQTIISGGYQYVPGFLELPKEVDLKHAHGLTRDNEDNIYLAYESNKVIHNVTHAIAMFNKQGKFIRYIGNSNYAWGTPHGLDLVYENGEKFLYLSNNWLTVRKLNMQGEVVWQSAKSPDVDVYKEDRKKYRPTDTATNPETNQLYVADGYGKWTITERDKNSGEYLGKLWQGSQSCTQFQVPHGVTFDSRNKQVLVSDRRNERIVAYTPEGKFIKEIKGKGISRVCNTDVWQDQLLVPNLNGTVSYLDKNNQLIDTIELNKVLGEEGHKHPHDAIFMSNGDIVIGTWKPGRLSYWKKL